MKRIYRLAKACMAIFLTLSVLVMTGDLHTNVYGQESMTEFPVKEDAYVRNESSANTNYDFENISKAHGAQYVGKEYRVLNVKYFGSDEIISVMKFDLPTVSQIESNNINAFAFECDIFKNLSYNNADQEYVFHYTTDSDWIETEITWNKKPSTITRENTNELFTVAIKKGDEYENKTDEEKHIKRDISSVITELVYAGEIEITIFITAKHSVNTGLMIHCKETSVKNKVPKIVGYTTNYPIKDNSLRVGTFNIAANKIPNVEAQRNLTDMYNLEIVGLQEVDVNTSRNKYDMLEKFKQNNYISSYFSKAINYGGGEYGVGTVSRYPISDGSFTYVNTTGAKEARLFQRSLITKKGRKIAFYNLHFSWEKPEIREKQFKQLQEAIANDPVEYKIIVGDFNADQYHSEFYSFLETMDMVNGYDGIYYDTYNIEDATMKVNSIDNIIVSRNLAIKHIEMVPTTLSDHNLLFAELEFLDAPVVSKQLLKAYISEYKDVESIKYTLQTIKEFEEALASGMDGVKENISQKEVDKLAKELKDAYENLMIRPPVNKNNLETVINGISNLQEIEYTPASWSKLQEVLTESKTILDDNNALQEKVDEAEEALKNAIQDLDERANIKQLESLINEIKNLKEGEYTEESWQFLEIYLEAAKTMLKNDNALQGEVDNVYDDLYNAKEGLVEKEVVIFTKLKEAITVAKELDLNKYTEDSVEKLLAVITKAENLIKGNPTQVEVDAMEDELLRAIDDLEILKSTDLDKTKLIDLMNSVSKIDFTKYTPKSVETLNKALERAKEVMDIALNQSEIDDAYAELSKVIANLACKTEPLNKPNPTPDSGSNKETNTSTKGIKTGDSINRMGLWSLLLLSSGYILYSKHRIKKKTNIN